MFYIVFILKKQGEINLKNKKPIIKDYINYHNIIEELKLLEKPDGDDVMVDRNKMLRRIKLIMKDLKKNKNLSTKEI